MDTPSTSLFDRFIARPRPLWGTVGVSLLFFLAPLGATHLDGSWDVVLAQGYWRPLLVPSVVIVYILAAAQMMTQSEAHVLKAFRPLVLVSDDDFDRLVREASRISPSGEVIAFSAGAIFGFWAGRYWLAVANTIWLRLYGPVSQSLMMGLLGWTIYYSIASTRLITALHRQPLQIDILDTKPFEPMGRHSLVAALIFVGGITLGVVFGLDVENVLSWQAWLFYLPLAPLPVLVFFLSMRDTHRVLAAEKNRELQAVAQNIQHACRVMRMRIAEHESLGAIAGELTALVAYEERLQAASTWPCNIGMLRTLFFTILAPLLGRILSDILFG
jgi:hypothetical protein